MATTTTPERIKLRDLKFSRFEYLFYFKQLWKNLGWRALHRQFWYAYRRPYSRALIAKHAPRGYGIEIGVGAQTVVPVGRTVLTDGFHSHANTTSLAQVYCPADRIPFEDGTFDFVLSEHVLEHLANPLRALREWARVLKPEGVLFLFLPHANRTFDRNRGRTPLAHVLEDDRRGVVDPDLTHLEEWDKNVIRAGLAPHYADIPLVEQARTGILHHHVWVTEDMIELLTEIGYKVVHADDQCPDRTDSFVLVAVRP